jgi:hypothetical protein
VIPARSSGRRWRSAAGRPRQVLLPVTFLDQLLHSQAETWKSSFPGVQMCVPKESLYPGPKLRQMAHGRKAERQFLILPGGSLFAVTPEVRCLDIVGMVVSPRPAHASRIDVVGHDVVIVGERHLTDGALPVQFDNLSIK